MDAEGKRVKEQLKALPPKEKIKHFWEYYKKHTIFAIIAVIVVAVEIVNIATRVNYDLEISAFTCLDFPLESADILAEELKGQCHDINGNGSVDIKIIPNMADVKDNKYNPETDTVLQKLQVDIISNSCPGYIVDESYKTLIDESFPDVIKSEVKISKSSELWEKLGISDKLELYWISVVEYENAKDNEKTMKKYELVEKIEEYFKKVLQESEKTE